MGVCDHKCVISFRQKKQGARLIRIPFLAPHSTNRCLTNTECKTCKGEQRLIKFHHLTYLKEARFARQISTTLLHKQNLLVDNFLLTDMLSLDTSQKLIILLASGCDFALCVSILKDFPKLCGNISPNFVAFP